MAWNGWERHVYMWITGHRSLCPNKPTFGFWPFQSQRLLTTYPSQSRRALVEFCASVCPFFWLIFKLNFQIFYPTKKIIAHLFRLLIAPTPRDVVAPMPPSLSIYNFICTCIMVYVYICVCVCVFLTTILTIFSLAFHSKAHISYNKYIDTNSLLKRRRKKHERNGCNDVVWFLSLSRNWVEDSTPWSGSSSSNSESTKVICSTPNQGRSSWLWNQTQRFWFCYTVSNMKRPPKKKKFFFLIGFECLMLLTWCVGGVWMVGK